MRRAQLAFTVVLACLGIAVCLGLCAKVVLGGESASSETSEEEAEIMELIEGAIGSVPMSPYDWNDPLDYFRPRLDSQGNINARIVEYHILKSEIVETDAILDISFELEDYYSSDAPRRTKGTVRIWAHNDGDSWKITKYKPAQ